MPLDADAQLLLDAMIKAGRPPFETLAPVEARRMMREIRAALKQPQPAMAEVRELAADGPHGSIPLRLYRGQTAPRNSAPVIVYFHGGGWVIGDLDTQDVLCRHMANEAQCVVVSVDYRLAPEHKFPVPVDDCWAALKWVDKHSTELALDRNRIAVAGDSAGGNLATVVSLLAAQTGEVRVRYQVLFYPAVDLAFAHESFRTVGTGFNLTTAGMEWFRNFYLNGPHEIEDWRASPLRARDLAKLPPAYITTAGCDPLCDDGESYARALEKNKVPVTFRHFPGQMHGFAGMSGFVKAADQVVADIGAALRRVWQAG